MTAGKDAGARDLVTGLGIIAIAVVGGAASTAGAQTYVGKNIEGGMHWHVAAPQGASWSLVCRFPPVTYWRTNYDKKAWINRFARESGGSQGGRLPLNVGHCHLTKTGGRGAVGLALARSPTEVVSDGTRDPAEPAAVGFL
jgi:hypothetical protein